RGRLCRILGVVRARLARSRRRHAAPVAEVLPRPALAVHGAGDGILDPVAVGIRERASGKGSHLVQEVIAVGRPAGVVQFAEGGVDLRAIAPKPVIKSYLGTAVRTLKR